MKSSSATQSKASQPPSKPRINVEQLQSLESQTFREISHKGVVFFDHQLHSVWIRIVKESTLDTEDSKTFLNYVLSEQPIKHFEHVVVLPWEAGEASVFHIYLVRFSEKVLRWQHIILNIFYFQCQELHGVLKLWCTSVIDQAFIISTGDETFRDISDSISNTAQIDGFVFFEWGSVYRHTTIFGLLGWDPAVKACFLLIYNV